MYASFHATETIKATLRGIRFQQPETGFLIGDFLSDKNMPVSGLGTMISEPIPGMEYNLTGHWEENKQYGKQFKFDTAQSVEPESDNPNAVARYIAHTCKGIFSRNIADKIVDEFGGESLEVIKNTPEQISAKIKKLPLEKVKLASNRLLSLAESESTLIELTRLLNIKGLRHNLPLDIFQVWGTQSIAKITDNPYRLVRFTSVGFVTADKVALKSLNHDSESDYRKRAAIIHILHENEAEGHTWMGYGDLLTKANALLAGIQTPIEPVVEMMVDSHQLARDGYLQTRIEVDTDERMIADKFCQLVKRGPFPADDFCLESLSDEQAIALDMVKRSAISAMCGAPGVGKTFTLKAILEWAKSRKMVVSQAAPTGKAAKRMAESTGYPASTIHRLLLPIMDRNGHFRFNRNAVNQFRLEDLIVLDECSMIPLSLLASVMEAIDPAKTRILFVGDPYQLPSVGAGACLRDIIASGIIPVTRLTKIQRNSGDIVRACHIIKDGGDYEPSAILNPETGQNLRHIEFDSPEAVQAMIVELVAKRMPLRGYDPIKDVQVLSPVNSDSPIGCDALNELLQGALNPNPRLADSKFRIGDKIINTKNRELSGGYVVNGEMGEVIDGRDTGKLTVQFASLENDCAINRNDPHILLAYCITCHRAQGSEAKVIIIPSMPFRHMDRCWIYTAISRAQDICLTVGRASAIRQAIRKETSLERITRLEQRLVEGVMKFTNDI